MKTTESPKNMKVRKGKFSQKLMEPSDNVSLFTESMKDKTDGNLRVRAGSPGEDFYTIISNI